MRIFALAEKCRQVMKKMALMLDKTEMLILGFFELDMPELLVLKAVSY